jgi:hypothetical protein
MYKRFNWNPEIRYNPKVMLESATLPGGSRVFVGSTMELFGKHIKDAWLKDTFYIAKRCPWITFIFLTKQPQNLIKFSPFPENCWVGVSCPDANALYYAIPWLDEIKASRKFISFEPLLASMWGDCLSLAVTIVQWLIIGACTGTKDEVASLCSQYPGIGWQHLKGNKFVAMPRIEWIREIVEAADRAGTPVFLKDNLKPLLVTYKDGGEYAPLWANGGYGTLRQELPSLRG